MNELIPECDLLDSSGKVEDEDDSVMRMIRAERQARKKEADVLAIGEGDCNEIEGGELVGYETDQGLVEICEKMALELLEETSIELGKVTLESLDFGEERFVGFEGATESKVKVGIENKVLVELE